MKRILIASVLLVAMVGQASAQHYQRRHYSPHRQHHGNAGAWVAGAIGLGVLGAIIANESRRSNCYDELAGYDRYGREVWRSYCN